MPQRERFDSQTHMRNFLLFLPSSEFAAGSFGISSRIGKFLSNARLLEEIQGARGSTGCHTSGISCEA
jgi:hypothetical protein